MTKFLFSEWLKYRRSFSKKLLVIAPVATAFLAWLMGGYINFQSMSVYWWYSFIMCGMVALLTGFAIQKEKQAGNYHSVYSLPMKLENFWIAKVIVVSLFVIISGIMMAFLTILFPLILSQPAAFSPVRLLVSFTAIAISALWQVPLCMILAQKAGMFIPLLGNALLGLFSTMIAGEVFWWISPYVWTAKLVEPLLGVKATGEIADPSMFNPVMIPVMSGLSILLFVILLVLSARWFVRKEVK